MPNPFIVTFPLQDKLWGKKYPLGLINNLVPPLQKIIKSKTQPLRLITIHLTATQYYWITNPQAHYMYTAL